MAHSLEAIKRKAKVRQSSLSHLSVRRSSSSGSKHARTKLKKSSAESLPSLDEPKTDPMPRNLTRTQSFISQSQDAIQNFSSEPFVLPPKNNLTFGFMSAIIDGGHSLDEQGISPVYKAAASGNENSLRLLLQTNWNIDIQNSDGSTALHAAVKGGYQDTVKYILDNGGTADIENKEKITPLHLAAENGSIGIVRLLCTHKASLETRTINDETPLWMAVEASQPIVCEYLLSCKSDPNTSSRFNGNTLLHIACKQHDQHTSRLLLKYAADINTPNIKGATPFNFISGDESGWLSVPTPKPVLTTEEKQKLQSFLLVLFSLFCKQDEVGNVEALIETGLFPVSPTPTQRLAPLAHALLSHANNIAGKLMDSGAQLFDFENNLPTLIFESQSDILLEKMFFSIAASLCNKKATTMDFSQCQLKSIPGGLIRIFLQNQDSQFVAPIRCFNFKHNEIQNVPQELLDLPEYVDVKLEGNPLDMIPEAYRRSSWVKVKEYLNSIRDRAKQWRDCKLLLLGQESAGKSTLLRCLMNKKSKSQCKQNLSTNGISIHRQIKFQLDDSEQSVPVTNQSVYFNAWDFGGQEVFYPTHRFFLTNNAVYIVTFKLSLLVDPQTQTEAEARISYWMQQVRLATMKSKQKLIYIVGTHLDSVDPEASESALHALRCKFPRQRFPGMQCVVAVSCKTGEGIKELKIMIQNDVTKKELLPLVPPSWVKLYDYVFIQKMHITFKSKEKLSNWISRKKFDEIAKRCGLETADIPVCADFLQDIGIVVLHQSDSPTEGHRNIVILKPQWLADVMSTLITFNHTWIKNGFLRLADVPHVFCKYEESVHSALLEMLENFSIIYRIRIAPQGVSLRQQVQPGIQGIFVPSVLPDEPATMEKLSFWAPTTEDTEEIGRIYIFPFLPLGLIERIIVRTFHIPGFAPHYFWRNGGFLYYRAVSSEADLYKIYLVFDPNLFQLTLRMRSTDCGLAAGSHLSCRAAIFSLLIDSIDTSLEEYKLGDVAERFIPCTHCVESQVRKNNSQKKGKLSIRNRARTLAPGKMAQIDYNTVFLFTYLECILAVTEGDGVLFCHHIRSTSRVVDVQTIAPDIALAGVPLISPDDLVIEKKIGEGGFGKVYRGTLKHFPVDDMQIPSKKQVTTQVAIKEATVSFKEADYIYSDFRQEVFIMTQIYPHPNIVRFYGIALKPCPRMVLEFVACGDLHQFLQPDIPHTYESLPYRLRILIAWDIAKGMLSLHSQTPPIIHRDLRSPNIFMDSFSEKAPVRAKVADFGLSRMVAPSIYGVLDTWQWLAPEVIGVIESAGKAEVPYGCPSDVYSFGICCWEIATCKNPFTEFETDPRFCRKSEAGHIHFAEPKVKRAIYTENLRPTLPEPASAENPNGMPSAFIQLIEDCWQTKPSERPSFKEIIHRLESMLEMFSVRSDLTRHQEKLHILKQNMRGRKILRGPLLENSKPRRGSVIAVVQPKHLGEFVDCGQVAPIHTVKLPLRFKCRCLCFVANEAKVELWAGSEDGIIVVVDASVGHLPVTTHWHGHTAPVIFLECVENTVWSAGKDGTIAIWNSSYSLVKEWKLEKKKIATCIRWVRSGSGSVWIGGDGLKNIRVFNTSGQIQHLIPVSKGTFVCSMCECGDNVWVGIEREVLLINSQTLERIANWIAHPSFVVSMIAVSPRIVWTACDNGEICLWEVDERQITCAQRHTEQGGQHIVSLRNWGRNRLISTAQDHIVLWDTAEVKPIQELESTGNQENIDAAVISDGKVCVVDSCGQVSLFKLE